MFHEVINHATKEYPFLIEHINVKYIPHFHIETELVYVLDGSLNVTIENEHFTLKKEEICIITPKLIHNLYSYENSKTFVMKLFPVIDISNIRLTNNVISPGSADYNQIKGYITSMLFEDKTKSLGYKLSTNIIAEKIFLFIIRNMKYCQLEELAQTKLATKSEFLDSVTSYLEEHYAESFSLEDVSKKSNYTKSYFCHYFKRITGVSFWHYYTIFRLEKSIQMMKKYPKKKYIEISEMSGFKNIRSFNQAFKEYHHCTPREYIKKYCQDFTESYTNNEESNDKPN